MSEYVVIRLAAVDQQVQWILVDGRGSRRGGVSSGSLEQAAAEAAGERAVIVLVPAADVLLSSVNMPTRSASKIRTALPFALEEDLAENVDNLHFAIGERQENNRLPVAVVSRDKISEWLARLNEAGIEPAILVSEAQGLAKIPGTISVLIDADAVMFNDGADTEFCMENVKPSDVLAIAGHLSDPPSEDGDRSGHLLVFCTTEQDQALAHEWIALRQELHSVDINILPDGVLPKLAVTIASGRGVNLLQGEYGKQKEYRQLLRPWKIAALLLLGLAFSSMAMKGAAYFQMLQHEADLRAQFITEYRSIRPDDTREIVDPVGTVESLRRRAGTSTSTQVFLPGIRALGVALAANSEAELESIFYRAGVIDLRLTTPDVITLGNIEKAVSASGQFQAIIKSESRVADKTDGRIEIREAGS